MADKQVLTNVWRAVVHNPVTGQAVELDVQPAEIPAVWPGGTFTITWGADGTARLELAPEPENPPA